MLPRGFSHGQSHPRHFAAPPPRRSRRAWSVRVSWAPPGPPPPGTTSRRSRGFMADETRYEFGSNWRSFVQTALDDRRVAPAADSLKFVIDVDGLRGLS